LVRQSLHRKVAGFAAGWLARFSVARNPRLLTDERRGCFELQCDDIPGAVDRPKSWSMPLSARAHTADSTPLYRNLRRSGMVRAYENRSV